MTHSGGGGDEEDEEDKEDEEDEEEEVLIYIIHLNEYIKMTTSYLFSHAPSEVVSGITADSILRNLLS